MIDDIRHDVLAANTRFRVRGNSMLPTFRSGDEIIVDQVLLDTLVPGDCVFITTGNKSYVHRYLGRTNTAVLTKGDGRRIPDPVWDASAIRGRVIEAWRGEVCIYTRTPLTVSWNRVVAYKHRITGFIWKNLRRVKAGLLAFILLLFVSSMVMGAVTLAHFEVVAGSQEIYVNWETASEVGNLGFYLWRSEAQATGYYKLPVSDPNLHFIPSVDEGAGAFYEYIDDEVTAGVLYYYKLQDVPDTGAEGEYSQPLSAGIGLATATPTLTPSLTPTATPTKELTNTATPTPQPANPYVKFWTDREEFPAGECATLQWQTANVKAVYLNGEGVSGLGAKTYCPCADEAHTLTVYFQDNSSREYSVALTVKGECDTSTINPTHTTTPTNLSPPPSSDEPTPTPSPQPLNMPTRNTTVVATNTAIASKTPNPTPTQEEILENSGPRLPSTNPFNNTPTPTRVIVQGQNPRQPILGQAAGLLIFATLAGFSFIGIGVWLWRRR